MTVTQFIRDIVKLHETPAADPLFPPAYLPKSMHPFTWHFHQAIDVYRDGKADLALHHFEQCRKLIPTDWYVVHHMAQIHLQLIGDVHEAIRLFKYARRLRERLYTPTEGKLAVRFLDPMWAAQIGHIANMEHLIKREMLRKRDSKNLILLCPNPPANAALLEKMSAYITVVKSEADLPHPRQAMQSVLEEYYICESIDGSLKHWWHASPEIFRAWESDGRPPLLTLTDEERAQGRAALRKAGIPEGAWFATLHIREGGFKRDQGRALQESGLNADCTDYIPAVQAVIDRGGWVVRIGDGGMSPLPSMPGLFDYAHSRLKSPAMDLFLLGDCRFFIGTSSGPAYVPPLFGIPCALTNWYPTGSRPFNERDIYIPKLFKAGKPPRLLRFEDMFVPPIGYALHYVNSAEMDLEPVANTPDEICEVVIEMLDRLDKKLSYSDDDRALQKTFEAVAETNFCFGNAHMGAAFLRRHKELLV